MSFASINIFARVRKWRAMEAEMRTFHNESRAHIAALAREGKANIALEDGMRLLGGDPKKDVRARLVSVRGVRL